jgi:hypothetical protein
MIILSSILGHLLNILKKKIENNINIKKKINFYIFKVLNAQVQIYFY